MGRLILEDIETLNQKALRGEYEVTAISVHAYALLDDMYRIISAGASVGDGYDYCCCKNIELESKKVAIPGRYTTATFEIGCGAIHFS